MKILDLTLETPEENLACDEALLDQAESGKSDEVLRFWESPKYFIVLGMSNTLKGNVHVQNCQEDHLPILRRVSGGGTVLQGAGCFNYTLILNLKNRSEIQGIKETNGYVMKKHTQALSSILGNVEFKGDSDLSVCSLKFSGNAQRRKKSFCLFHGTFLLNMDFQYIEKYLTIPEKEPVYRNHRPHKEFLTNLSLSNDQIKQILIHAWSAKGVFEPIPLKDIQELVRSKYSTSSWNLKY